MRYDRLMLLGLLWGGMSLGAGCNGLDDDDPGDDDDDDVPGDDDDDTDTDTDTDTDDTGPFVEVAFVGEGTITGSDYAGQEAFVATLGPATPTPTVLCEWTWQADGTLPSAAALPCTDDQGNACEFTLAVDLTNGAQTDGDCSVLNVELPADLPLANYGFVLDYAGLGPSIMYYLPADANDPVNFPAAWYFFGSATYDDATGAFAYRAPQALYSLP